ncbi:MAG: glycosyltransferase family 4 protein [Ignavibacteriae bacterium]|nr:glycosyltransferase family 4 protein [Ignavibacteriota bacterium]
MPQTPQHIAFICFSHALGGLELSALRLGVAMLQRNVAISIIAPEGSPLARRAAGSNIPHIPITPRLKYGDVFAARKLARTLNEQNIDSAIIMQSKDIHLAALASFSARKTKFVFLQQMQSGFNKRGFVHTWMYSRLSLWITLTERMKEDVAKFTRFPVGKVLVNPIGVDVSKLDPTHHSRQTSRVAFKLPEKKFLIGVLGRLDPQKGQEMLLLAAPEILKRHPDTALVIAGDETAGEKGYAARLHELARRLGIERSVVFLPFTDRVAEFMSALDVFVLPSFSETFGYVLVEAMAMEKPVVATNAGGVPEIIEHGKTGFLVEPRDPAALAQAVILLIEDDTLSVSLGRTARAKALQQYDINRCAQQLLEAISAQ